MLIWTPYNDHPNTDPYHPKQSFVMSYVIFQLKVQLKTRGQFGLFDDKIWQKKDQNSVCVSVRTWSTPFLLWQVDDTPP